MDGASIPAAGAGEVDGATGPGPGPGSAFPGAVLRCTRTPSPVEAPPDTGVAVGGSC